MFSLSFCFSSFSSLVHSGPVPQAVTILSLTLGQSLLQEGQLFVTVAHPATGQLLSQLCTFDTKGWAEVMRSYQEFEDAYNSISVRAVFVTDQVPVGTLCLSSLHSLSLLLVWVLCGCGVVLRGRT